jgi:hypothetical protein
MSGVELAAGWYLPARISNCLSAWTSAELKQSMNKDSMRPQNRDLITASATKALLVGYVPKAEPNFDLHPTTRQTLMRA